MSLSSLSSGSIHSSSAFSGTLDKELLRLSILDQLAPEKEYKTSDDEISFGGHVKLSVIESDGGGIEDVLPPISPMMRKPSPNADFTNCSTFDYSHFNHELTRSVKHYVGSRSVDCTPSPLMRQTFRFNGNERLGSPRSQLRSAMSTPFKRRSPSRKSQRTAPGTNSEHAISSVIKPVFTFDDHECDVNTEDALFDELERISTGAIQRVRGMYKHIAEAESHGKE